jgi:Virulence factor
MSVEYQIVSWRDIPAHVKVREGRTRVSRSLPERFQQAIDESAMRAGKSGSDDYLNEWRTSTPTSREGEAEAVATQLVSELEAAYPQDRLQRLAAQRGLEGS